MVLVDFNKNHSLKNWQVVDDTVMGGQSNGNIKVNKDGNAVYSGYVSLENNGGFSSVRYQFSETDISSYSKAILHVKGDGKRYQFRLKKNKSDRHSYIKYFETQGDWQKVEINLNEMIPTFRGRKLDMPFYSPSVLEEIAFLIGNKNAEEFHLEINKILFE